MPEYVGQVRREKKKPTVRFPYNEFVLTRRFKNVVELSKIYLQLRPLCKFDTSGDWFRERIAKAILSVVSVYNVLFSGRSKMSGWKWQYADKACSCFSRREKAEPSASDNCRMCSCSFKTRGTQRQFSENICSEDNMRSRILGTYVVKFIASLPLLGFPNI